MQPRLNRHGVPIPVADKRTSPPRNSPEAAAQVRANRARRAETLAKWRKERMAGK